MVQRKDTLECRDVIAASTNFDFHWKHGVQPTLQADQYSRYCCHDGSHAMVMVSLSAKQPCNGYPRSDNYSPLLHQSCDWRRKVRQRLQKQKSQGYLLFPHCRSAHRPPEFQLQEEWHRCWQPSSGCLGSEMDALCPLHQLQHAWHTPGGTSANHDVAGEGCQ